MKKIISLILSAAILSASAAALADYTPSDYDIENVSLTYDDGTDTNPIDGTPALSVGSDMTRLFSTSIDSTKEFILSFDFRFDNESGFIEVPKYKGSGDVDKVGPRLSFDSETARLTTDISGGKQGLGSFAVGEWYSAEIEGRTGLGAQYTTFRLYNYPDGERTLVQETTNFNMRNLSSEGRSFNGMSVRDLAIDNVRLIEEKPDTITVSAADEMNAGTEAAFDYVMTRQDKEFNKYDVTWSVYDESDSERLTDENISISADGVLSAGIYAAEQTVTVRATAVFGDKELYGAKRMKINAVDVSSEKFDEITVTGSSSIRAGTSESFAFTAKKNGVDVTDTLSDSDVVWSIYNGLGLEPNNNIHMSVENGVVTIGDSVIPQTITVRASSPGGTVYGGARAEIMWSEKQTENVLSYNACETEMTNTTLIDSWDGSKAYLTSDNVTFGFGDQTAYVITDVDIKFDGVDGHGLTLFNNNGSENSNIRVHDGTLSQQTSGSNWTIILTESEFDADAWYHIEFLYLNGAESGYNVYKYDENGARTLVKTMPDCNRRNDKPYGKITFTAGLAIDNFKTAIADADDVVVTAPGQYMFAGETKRFTAAAKRSGLTMANYGGLTWAALDEGGLPIIDGSVTADESGNLTVSSTAAAQTVRVRASSPSGCYGEAEIIVQISEIFTVTNLGVNEEKTAITRLYVDKNFYYNDDVIFIVTVKSDAGELKAVKLISTFGDRLNIGSNELSTDLALPADFDPASDKIETMVWTAF